MSNTARHTVIPRVMCVVTHQDQVLLLNTASHKEQAGFHNIIGGHIEKGEDIIEAANREIFEETGLYVKDTRLKGIIHVADFFQKQIMMFITHSTANTTKVIANDEGELEWVRLDKLSTKNIIQDVIPILEYIQTSTLDHVFTGKSTFIKNAKITQLVIDGIPIKLI